jgi:hypothetical protein
MTANYLNQVRRITWKLDQSGGERIKVDAR